MITYEQFTCPECGKRRLIRPEGHIVSDKKIKKELSSGKIIEHFYDICARCVDRLTALYYTPPKSDVKKVLQALDSGQSLGDKSIEELL